MYFERIYEEGLAQAGYFIGCDQSKTALVIDPKRDVDTYCEIAERRRFRITHVGETHIHADFLSGARELAAITGAEIFLSDEGGGDWQYRYDHVGLKDGRSFQTGKLRFDVMHTPGHTPEHICFFLTDTSSGNVPIMIFTGDFVFVGSVGRPDLLEKAVGVSGSQEIGARQMFESLRRFKSLPEHVQVFPGHGAGSACGKALGSLPGSTIGYEKLVNWALQDLDEDDFVRELLAGQPEVPKYFSIMKRLNRDGPPILGGVPSPSKLSLTELEDAVNSGMTLVDVRDKFDFAAGHIPGSLNIQNNNSFSNWAGWLLDYEKPFVLIAHENQIGDLTRKLIRIGLDQVSGYFADLEAWSKEGHGLNKLAQVNAQNVETLIKENAAHVIDVRSEDEYSGGHIPSATHIHLGDLADHIHRIPRDKTLIIHCASGDRSSTGCSILQQEGIEDVANFVGGMDAWRQKGYEIERF